MIDVARILLIDNNPVSKKVLAKTFENAATLFFVQTIEQAAEVIQCNAIDIILITADSKNINAPTLCAWLKSEPASRELKLIVLTQNVDSHKELQYFESGADDVVYLTTNQALTKRKILRSATSELGNNPFFQASRVLNTFYENIFRSDSLSHCMSECLLALQAMNLQAALHVCDHPELTCSSFGYVDDYEKALLNYAGSLNPSGDSGRFTHGDETMSILIQNLPNGYHPLQPMLIDWVKRVFSAVSYKAKIILKATANANEATQSESDMDIPRTAAGAQRLHYFVGKALGEMEESCEKEINRSIGRLDEVTTWPLTRVQKGHVLKLKDNLLQLKETLVTNCLEIESRYLQFVSERRAKSRLDLGW
jgi:CheY-like chemotaxis protein